MRFKNKRSFPLFIYMYVCDFDILCVYFMFFLVFRVTTYNVKLTFALS
jgi:hypothetical protein